MFEKFFSVQKKIMGPLLWNGKLAGGENLPRQGPAVFIANHMDALGPIAITCALPLRFKSWMIADIVDKDLAPAYFQKDFIERQLHFKPPLSRWISLMISKINVPFLHAIGSIPVYTGDYDGIRKTMDLTMDALRKGEYIMIFPENPFLPADPVTKMNPFMHSFARLGEMYYAETGKCLEFYPLAVHPKKYVVVGKPVAFNPLNPVAQERRRIRDLMESSVKSMYLVPDPGAWNANPVEMDI
jgi:hypothetical protein